MWQEGYWGAGGGWQGRSCQSTAARLPPSLHSGPPDTQQSCTSRSCRQQPLVMILLLSSPAREAIPFPENTRSNFLAFRHSPTSALGGSGDAEAARPGRSRERSGLWGTRAPDWPRRGNLLTTLPAAVAGLRRLVGAVPPWGKQDLYLESRGCCEAALALFGEYHEQNCPAASLREKTRLHDTQCHSIYVPWEETVGKALICIKIWSQWAWKITHKISILPLNTATKQQTRLIEPQYLQYIPSH